MLKKSIIILYATVILVMAVATFLPQETADAYVYGSWWFSLLWALLAGTGLAYYLKIMGRRLIPHRSSSPEDTSHHSVASRKGWGGALLHFSLIVILLGALLTHTTGKQSSIHLRQGVEAKTLDDGTTLPFGVTLKKFSIEYYPGTQMPSNYTSTIQIDNDETVEVSMNNICSHHGVRLYQSSYDSDLQGSVLSVNIDPYGITVTYFGYALLFISLLAILVARLRRNIGSKTGADPGTGGAVLQA